MVNISKKVTRLFSIMLMLMITTLASGAAVLAAGPPQQSDKTIVDIVVEDGRFTNLVGTLQTAQLVDILQQPGPFTVFAPTDEAFAAVPPEKLMALLPDIPALQEVLLYHVWAGEVRADQVAKLGAADTLAGQQVQITVEGSTVKLNDAQIVVTDIVAANGVIHVIDTVLLPPPSDSTKPDHEPPPPPTPMDPDKKDPPGAEPPNKDHDSQAPPHQGNDSRPAPPPPHYSPNTYYYLPTPHGYRGPYGGYGYYNYQGYTRWWHIPRHYR